MAEDEDVFLVVLIDEVESLTAARAGAISGQEPSDALRVVNALLTQLDKLKHKKNVLFMSTSNLVTAIDPAFRDRADIVRYIGLPPTEAIYDMLHSCLIELMSKGIVHQLPVPNRLVSNTSNRLAMAGQREWDVSNLLWTLSEKCKGLSGRALRRLPVLAHAHAIARGVRFSSRPPPESPTQHRPQPNGVNGKKASALTVEQWIKHMDAVVQESREQLEKLV